MISFTNVSLNFGENQALHKFNAKIAKNALLALVGPNGAGKSSLLKCLLGFYKPDSGTISLNLAKSKIAYLAQINTLDKSFPINVKDTVAMGFWNANGLHKSINKSQKTMLDNVLEKLNLTKLQKQPIANLSGGELQKTMFARIMLADADLILLDEPFAAIDAATTKELLQLMQEWHKQGKTIVAVMHDLHQVRQYFPESLLVSKTNIAHSKTAEVLTQENLAKALKYSLLNKLDIANSEVYP